MSAEGQQIIEDNGYIRAAADAAAYAGGKPEGKIVVAGSSSVSPVMEKLKEAYTALNPAAVIEIQTSDSTSGMTAAMDGTCDIGMASRELKDEEAAALIRDRHRQRRHRGRGRPRQPGRGPHQRAGKGDLHRRGDRVERGGRLSRFPLPIVTLSSFSFLASRNKGG